MSLILEPTLSPAQYSLTSAEMWPYHLLVTINWFNKMCQFGVMLNCSVVEGTSHLLHTGQFDTLIDNSS